MALQRTFTTLWMEITTAYSKIVEIFTSEEKTEAETKTYKIWVTVKTFTNDTKEYEVDNHTYYFEWLKETELNLPNLYELLKQEEWFINSQNV